MEGGTTMMGAVTGALTDVIGAVGDVVTAIISGELSGLLELLAIGVAVSLFFVGELCAPSLSN